MCDVCKINPAKGVACVPGIPMSVAYCETCIREGADPYWAIRANIACCGGPEHVRQEYLESIVFFRGQYVPIKDALAIEPMTSDEINCGPEA